MHLSQLDEVPQNRTKYCNKKTNKQNKTTNDHFSAKNKVSISEPNFTKSEQKVRFEQFFLKPGLIPATNVTSPQLYRVTTSPSGYTTS